VTAEYDRWIADTLQQRSGIDDTRFTTPKAEKMTMLRYGENPAQQAMLYRDARLTEQTFIDAEQLQGKALSYNNWLDSDSAFRLIQEFNTPAAVIVKHTNPCGVAIADTIQLAFERAH